MGEHLNKNTEGQRGFTLIELLTIVAMIGVLAAITLPLLENYKRRSFDTQSQNDLKNAALGEEAYFAIHSQYTDCIGTITCEAVLPNYKGSVGSNVSMFRVPAGGGTVEHFTGQAWHPQGTRDSVGQSFLWNSQAGGLQ